MMKALLAAAQALSPAVALACPVCARDQTPWTPLLIGGLVVAPYLVTIVVVRAIRSWGDEP
jgi:hypothetical protein